ncbi:hypothetical protein ADUPG1_004814, partial [Aduncisulcus paluster]
ICSAKGLKSTNSSADIRSDSEEPLSSDSSSMFPHIYSLSQTQLQYERFVSLSQGRGYSEALCVSVKNVSPHLCVFRHVRKAKINGHRCLKLSGDDILMYSDQEYVETRAWKGVLFCEDPVLNVMWRDTSSRGKESTDSPFSFKSLSPLLSSFSPSL